MEENSLSVRYARTRRDLTAVNEDIMDMPRNYDRIGELRKRREQLENQFIAADKAYKEKRAEVNELTKAYNTLYTQHWHLERQYNGLDPTAAPQQRREFIMRCPADGCRGFLSSAYKCGLCSKWTCTKCLECIGEAKEGEHTCKPESVESAKLIQKETRPCPKCGTRIYKIDGCDQMWCVMEGCNTAFSWNTGHVVTGTIHNPHYYEWLRRTGGNLPRETGDIPCGGIPGFHFLNRIGRCLFLNEGLRNKLYAVHRGLNDFNEVRLPQFPARPPAMMNKDENVRYLMNEVNEEEWQRLLVNKESRFIRKREIGQILQTIITAGSDLLNGIDARITAVSAVYDRAITQMQQQVQTRVLTPALRNDALRQGRIDVSARIRTEQKEAIEWLEGAALTQLEELRAYANDSYKLLGKRMHMAVPQIAEDWTWKPVRILYRDPSKKKKAPAAAAGTAQNMIEGDGDSDTEEADALI